MLGGRAGETDSSLTGQNLASVTIEGARLGCFLGRGKKDANNSH